MTLRRTAFRWTVHFNDPLMTGEVAGRLREVIDRWQQLYPKAYSDGWLTGEALGVIQVGIVITKNDRWMATRESRRFAAALAARSKVAVRVLGIPDEDNLPPHTNRGFKARLAALNEVSVDGA